MPKYLVSEVEKLSGVKSHTLRSWEEKVPIFSPQKDSKGNRCYSQRDLEVIVRMKYLIYQKGYKVEAAARQVIDDAQIDAAQETAVNVLREIRSQLGEMYQMLKKSGENYNLRKNQLN